jgi:membrane-associated phospholipid phosphatase
MSLVSDAPETPGLRAEHRDAASALDLCDARPGSLSARVGARLSDRHPGTAALMVGSVMLALLLVIVVGWGLVLTDVLLPGALKRWDTGMVRWFVDRRTPTRNDLGYVCTMLADAITVLGVALVVLLVLGYRRMWRLASLLAFGLLFEVSTYGAGSVLVPRFRPPFHRLEILTENTSYPSGHTAAAVVLYFCLAILVTNFTTNRLLRALAWTVAVVAPVLVGVSRLYRAMHNPTDVATGYVLGILCVIAAVFVVRVTGVVEEAHANRQERA